MQCRPYDSTNIWSSVIIQDISEGGMSFLAKRGFQVEEQLEIKVVTFIRRQPILIVGKVVGSQKGFKGDDWITRIFIVQIDEEDKLIYQEFMQIFLKEQREATQ